MGTTNILDLNNRVGELEKAVSGGDSDQANKADIATEFNTTTAYTAGCFVYHGGKLYQFNTDHAAGAWDPTDVVEANVTDQIVSNYNTFKDYTEKSNIAPTFTEANNYNKGDLVYYEGTLYEFNQAHTAGAWNASHVDAKDIDGVIKDAVSAISNYAYIKTVTSDGIKTWKTLINELFDGVNLYISSDIILTIAQSRFSLNYNATTSKRFVCIYSGLNVQCVNYNPSNIANTAYTSYSITTSGVTTASNTDVVPASGEILRLYARSR